MDEEMLDDMVFLGTLLLNDKFKGYMIFIGSLLGIACYFYLMFIFPWALLVIQVSAFLAVAAVLLIMAWIGYTLATTPPPISLEEFEDEPSMGEES